MHHAEYESDLGRRMAAEAKTMRKPNYRAIALPKPPGQTNGVPKSVLAEDAKTMTAGQIADKHGLSASHVKSRLRTLGIKPLTDPSRCASLIDRIVKMRADGMSQRQIGTALHMSHARVGQLLRELREKATTADEKAKIPVDMP